MTYILIPFLIRSWVWWRDCRGHLFPFGRSPIPTNPSPRPVYCVSVPLHLSRVEKASRVKWPSFGTYPQRSQVDVDGVQWVFRGERTDKEKTDQLWKNWPRRRGNTWLDCKRRMDDVSRRTEVRRDQSHSPVGEDEEEGSHISWTWIRHKSSERDVRTAHPPF